MLDPHTVFPSTKRIYIIPLAKDFFAGTKTVRSSLRNIFIRRRDSCVTISVFDHELWVFRAARDGLTIRQTFLRNTALKMLRKSHQKLKTLVKTTVNSTRESTNLPTLIIMFFFKSRIGL